jgi:small ubiquitin-related modifier
MDGERLRPDQTPEEMDMEDGDCIDAMMEQVGGD